MIVRVPKALAVTILVFALALAITAITEYSGIHDRVTMSILIACSVGLSHVFRICNK